MAQLKIQGMKCGHCVKSVQEALLQVPGVEGAEVDLKAGTAQVKGQADPAALIGAVEEEGFKASIEAD
nr:heavy metal-associated domain-containing protein [uncultured Holophaga sp.]